MNLPKFSLKHKPIVLFGAVLLTVYGAYVYMTAPRKEDPSFNVRDAWIITVWPNDRARSVTES